MNPEQVGREGLLKLRFDRRGRNTILCQSRYSLPLQVLTPSTLEDGTSYLMLLNPTGGLLGGDHLVTNIVQGPETQVCLTSPSCPRVYRSSGKPAVQETRIELNEGASLEYFPDHVIPHAGARLNQMLRIEMAPGSRALIYDALAAGRIAHGERWDFDEIDSQMEVWMTGKPVLVSRTKINPADFPLRRLGIMEDFNYMGCLAAISAAPQDWDRVAALINTELCRLPEIAAGVSLLARGGCFARFLASSATDLTRAAQALWAVVRESLFHLTPFDLRKF